MQLSILFPSSSRLTPSQSLPQSISFFMVPKKPSMRELSGEQPFLDIGRMIPASSQTDIHPGHRQWHPQPLWMMRRALSLGLAGLMAASGIELSISAFGEADVVQLAMEPPEQSRTGERQGLPAGTESCVASMSRRKLGSPAAKSCLALFPGCSVISPAQELQRRFGFVLPRASSPSSAIEADP